MAWPTKEEIARMYEAFISGSSPQRVCNAALWAVQTRPKLEALRDVPMTNGQQDREFKGDHAMKKDNPAEVAALALHGEHTPAVAVCMIDADGNAWYWTEATTWKGAGALVGCMFVAATALAQSVDHESTRGSIPPADHA